MTNDFSGGLRGLRPPATFLQPFGLRWVSQLYRSPLMGPRSITSIANPAVNGWARENLIEQHNIQTPAAVSRTFSPQREFTMNHNGSAERFRTSEGKAAGMNYFLGKRPDQAAS